MMLREDFPLLLSLMSPDDRKALISKIPDALVQSAALAEKMRRLGPTEFADKVLRESEGCVSGWGARVFASDLVLHARTAAGKLSKRLKIDRRRDGSSCSVPEPWIGEGG